jgi:hypothetical protein
MEQLNSELWPDRVAADKFDFAEDLVLTEHIERTGRSNQRGDLI